MEKIAVTGATGFIGSHLVNKLKKDGFKLNVLVREKSEKGKKGVFYGDLVKNQGLENFLKGARVAVNLVGGYHPPFNNQLETNALALNNLCEAAIKAGVKKIIHISSSAVYGSRPQKGLFTERNKANPDTLYGLSKYFSEEIGSYYHKNYGLNFIILRPSNVYGPGNEDGVIYRFAKSIKEKGYVEIFGDGKNLRDYLFVDDMVNAIVKAIKFDCKFEVFNVGLGKAYSLLAVVNLFERVFERRVKIQYKKELVKTSYLIASNVNKAKKLLKWQPKHSVEEGLKITLSQI